MLSGDSMFPRIGDATQRAQLEARTLALLAAGIRTALITALIGPALIAWLTAPTIGLAAAIGPAALLYLITIDRVLFARRVARYLAAPGRASARPWLNAFTWRTGLSALVVALWGYPVVTSGDTTLVFMILALATIVSASSMAQFCCWPPAMWASFTPILLGLGLQLLVFGGSHGAFGVAFTVLLWITLGMAGLRFARTLHNDMSTRLLNEQLVHELDVKRQQAEAANAAKSRFFAAASHDLRQPLQAMGLYLSVLQGDGPTLARMGECMDALDRLLAQVMDLSRLDSGQTTAHPEPLALQPLLQRLADTYEAAARKKGLQLRVHPTTAWAQSDPVLLERVLANLLTNAIRYTERGGVLLGVRRQGAGLRLCVADTGIGIPPEAHEAVFEEFVQLDNAERNPERGHGLGLPTVRRIAALLDHPVGLHSCVGRGSVFTLDLPAAQPSDAPAPRTQPAAAGRLQGRVLVVEDNALARDALVVLLGGWGLDVTAVHDAPGALQALRAMAFDAVLSDWRLPGADDGLAVLRQARALQPGLKLAAMITGEDTQRMAEAPPDFPVLRKPVRPLRLRALLARYLREHKAT